LLIGEQRESQFFGLPPERFEFLSLLILGQIANLVRNLNRVRFALVNEILEFRSSRPGQPEFHRDVVFKSQS
jgi:hypothetical protein